ncbi:MAG: hypothetical protein ABI678_17340, partial [Kofleriaceae bacterium]
LKGHLDEARNAALSIERFTRAPLFADVDQVSREMDGVERALVMDPKFAWHAAFAGAFDSENRLRSSVGLPARARAYSGKVDPVAAAAEVGKVLARAERGNDQPADPATASPQALVVNVGLNIASAYERMHDGMSAFERAFSVTDPPKLSIGDILLNASVAFLLDVASAGVATYVSGALGKALAAPAAAASKAELEIEHIVVEGNVIPGALAASAPNVATAPSVNESLKSRVTGIMRGASAKAQILPGQPTAPTVLNHFVATALASITAAKLDSAKTITGLGEALAQLDVSALRALNEEMTRRVADPSDALYDRAVVEYEKLRTANAAAARAGRVDPLLDAKHLGNVRDEDIAGVLEVGLHVSASNRTTFDYLRLQAGEPAGRKWLHEHKQPLRNLGMHRIFHVRFDSAEPAPGLAALLQGRDYLTFGVGATEGLQLETINEQEWLWLRLLAADRPVDDVHAFALDLRDRDDLEGRTPQEAAAHLRHQLDMRISRDAALARVRSLIAFGDTLTSDKVEP